MIQKFEHYINNKLLFITFVRMAEHPKEGRRHLIFEASQSHHTGYDSYGRLIIPAQRPLPHKTQHSQQTDTMARPDSNLLSQQASDRRPTQHCLGYVFVLRVAGGIVKQNKLERISP